MFVGLCRKVRVSALMKDLPDNLVINIDALQIGKRIVAGDLKYDNITVISPKTTILCTVKATRQAKSN